MKIHDVHPATFETMDIFHLKVQMEITHLDMWANMETAFHLYISLLTCMRELLMLEPCTYV